MVVNNTSPIYNGRFLFPRLGFILDLVACFNGVDLHAHLYVYLAVQFNKLSLHYFRRCLILILGTQRIELTRLSSRRIIPGNGVAKRFPWGAHIMFQMEKLSGWKLKPRRLDKSRRFNRDHLFILFSEKGQFRPMTLNLNTWRFSFCRCVCKSMHFVDDFKSNLVNFVVAFLE